MGNAANSYYWPVCPKHCNADAHFKDSLLQFIWSFLCFLQISGHPLGDIALNIKVFKCFVSSKSSCPVEKELPFIPEPCSSISCPNSTRLSFSLDQLQELTSTTWDLECSVKLCYSEVGVNQLFLADTWNRPREMKVVLIINKPFHCSQ